ncbi:hypothetical protein C0V70_06495 [Bacteriovorax stolpii]|uniref:Uncharacterized protein n=1 Tax=Bacteriovorax stolpii TaxID=960 RepID=A0A2K9NQF8_BACTC|nr:winged helix-turn-helix domain-containing protein [Bacteriovorax stolpii]AUN97766.1 hypothetical protein C0V70_06495 [Bacteriovorax stolpii]TDP51586.1 hypothetical protein C8D79_3030 [Bacteriovorax stolpii]
MLNTIFGSQIAQMIMLLLYRYEEVYAYEISQGLKLNLRGVQEQLEKFENANLLVSRTVGRTRLYSFNEQSSFVKPLKDLIEVEYKKLSEADKKKIFTKRMRPRRAGKEIINE